MKFGSAEDFYIAYTEYVQELEDRAGVPRPCPLCGGPVHAFQPDGKYWEVACADKDVLCSYRAPAADSFQDAWREHERLCREAKEAEG